MSEVMKDPDPKLQKPVIRAVPEPSAGVSLAAAPTPAAAPGAAEEFAVSLEQMKQLLDVSRMLSVTTDLDALLLRIAEAATALLGCERASIFLHDPKTNELWTKVALQTREIRIPCGVGIAGHSFVSNSMIHVSQPYDDPRFNRETDRRTGFVTRNLLTLPMVDVHAKPVGVLQAVNKKDGDFTAGDKARVQLLADQAGVAIQRYQLQVSALESVAMRREMELARQVQAGMVPKRCPKVAGIETAGFTRSASLTGGDCYDLWELADGRLGVFLADCSGHGIAPALVVSQVRALIRAMCDTECNPHQLLTRINRRMAQDLEAGWFITAFVGFITPDGVLDWCSCGQGPVYVRQGRGKKLATLDPLVPPLGVLAELPSDCPPPMQLSSGGVLVLTSDGFFEAFNPAGEQFGSERLAAVIDDHADAPPEALVSAVRDFVTRWQGKDEPLDDQTMVVAAVR